MPPKPKLHKAKGKAQISLNKSKEESHSPVASSSESNNISNIEVQQQFELELCWCIQQLQGALSSGKLNEKQVQEQTKILNTLMSNSTSFVKKRQVMRLTFGDYRAKMAEESKKLAKSLNLKITSSEPSKKSLFVKKAVGASTSYDPAENDLSDNLTKVAISENSKSFHFINSKNEFRFNFNVEDQ